MLCVVFQTMGLRGQHTPISCLEMRSRWIFSVIGPPTLEQDCSRGSLPCNKLRMALLWVSLAPLSHESDHFSRVLVGGVNHQSRRGGKRHCHHPLTTALRLRVVRAWVRTGLASPIPCRQQKNICPPSRPPTELPASESPKHHLSPPPPSPRHPPPPTTVGVCARQSPPPVSTTLLLLLLLLLLLCCTHALPMPPPPSPALPASLPTTRRRRVG